MLHYKASQDGKTADIYIYGVVGVDVTALDFVKLLNGGNFETLVLHFNSPGGKIDDGMAIYNAVKSFAGDTIAIIDSFAGSIASIMILACDKIRAFETSTIFIHNPFIQWAGKANSKALERCAESLKKDEIVAIEAYCKKTGKDADEIRILMDAETTLTAKEAMEMGFVDEVISDEPARANALKTASNMMLSFSSHNFNNNSTKAETTEYKDWKEAIKDLKDFLAKLEDEALKTELQGIVDALDKLAEADKPAEGGEGGSEAPKEGDTQAMVDAAVQKAVAPLMEAVRIQGESFNRLLAQGGNAKPKFASKTEEYRSIKDETERRAFFAKHKTAILMGK